MTSIISTITTILGVAFMGKYLYTDTEVYLILGHIWLAAAVILAYIPQR